MKKLGCLLSLVVLGAIGFYFQEDIKGLIGSDTNSMQSSEQAISQDKTTLKDKKESGLSEEIKKTNVNDKCAVSELIVYLKDADDSGTNIRNSPGGEVVLTLKEDKEEAQYMLRLTASQDEWFKVKNPIEGMEEDIEIPNNEAWIHGSVIAVNTRNYGGEDLELLDNPENGKVVGVIKEESYGLRIKDLCGVWVKVIYEGTEGWIEASWLCGIPWTTCS